MSYVREAIVDIQNASNGQPTCHECGRVCTHTNGLSDCCGARLLIDYGPPPDDPGLSTRAPGRKRASIYIGVSPATISGKRMWRPHITARGKTRSLGCYPLDLDAAHIRDNAAFYLHREGYLGRSLLRLNFEETYNGPERPAPYSTTRQLLLTLKAEEHRERGLS